MPPTTKPAPKKISCKRCRFRKLKCSRTEPCTKCAEANHSCEYREFDTKRRPVSHAYVTSLENRVAWLETLLTKVKKASSDDRDATLNDVKFGDHIESQDPNASSNKPGSVLISGPSRHASLQAGAEGSLVYHGPTSIHYVWARDSVLNPPSCQDNLSPIGYSQDLHVAQVSQHFGLDARDELALQGLVNFFKWQYPHFMFIYREAFLRDHFNPNVSRKNWSGPLLFAVCALGLLIMPGPDARDASERFFATAESIMLVSGQNQPCITNVQAFLCLAYYEIGRGNLSKGWGFSGIAFRMVQDLGFQRDPHHWASTDKSITTSEEREIRRRIYWGCYVSDKLISLILGRPVSLYDDDAEVELMERLPDFPEMAVWLPVGYEDDGGHDKSLPLIPSFRAQIRLAKIIHRILTQLYSAKRNLLDANRKARIESLDLDLCRWECSLDESMKWNKWQPAHTTLIPTVAALYVLLYSLRIVVNLEMALASPSSFDTDHPQTICLSSAQEIISLLRKYRSQYSLQHAPLVFVYGIAQAIQAISSFGIPDELSFLLQALDECSPTWNLARDTKRFIHTSRNGGIF